MSIQDDHIARTVDAFRSACGEYYRSMDKKGISPALLEAKADAMGTARLQLINEVDDLIKQAIDKAIEEAEEGRIDAIDQGIQEAIKRFKAEPSAIKIFQEQKEGMRRDLQAIADNLVYIDDALDLGKESGSWSHLLNWCKFKARDLQHNLGSM